jgi:hypothetical protein
MGYARSPNKSPEPTLGAGPAISDEASAFHRATSFEKSACAQPQRGSSLTFGKKNMRRIALFAVLFTVIGCAPKLERGVPAVEAAAIIAVQILEAATAEDVKYVHLKVEGADAREVVRRSYRAGSPATFLTGSDEPEYRNGRLREKSSEAICYAIKIVVEESSAKSAVIRLYWNASFGGFSVTKYVLSCTHGAWTISEEQIGLIT